MQRKVIATDSSRASWLRRGLDALARMRANTFPLSNHYRLAERMGFTLGEREAHVRMVREAIEQFKGEHATELNISLNQLFKEIRHSIEEEIGFKAHYLAFHQYWEEEGSPYPNGVDEALIFLPTDEPGTLSVSGKSFRFSDPTAFILSLTPRRNLAISKIKITQAPQDASRDAIPTLRFTAEIAFRKD